MKQLFLILLLAAGIFASCSKGKHIGEASNELSQVDKVDGWYVAIDNNPLTLDSIPIVTLADIDTAYIEQHDEYNQLVCKLNAEAAIKWEEATKRNTGNKFAFVLNGKIVQCPKVNDAISSGLFSIYDYGDIDLERHLNYIISNK